MSVTKYRHHIDTIKGEDYVLHKDYTELMENLEQEIERLNNIIERINSIYRSMQFSAPENQYIFINQLGEVLKELKGSDKNE